MEKYNDFALTPKDKIEKLSKAYKENLQTNKVDIMSVNKVVDNQKQVDLQNKDYEKVEIASGTIDNTNNAGSEVGKNIGDVIDKIGSGTPAENINSPSAIPVVPIKTEPEKNNNSLNMFNLFLMYIMLSMIRCY